MAKDTYYFSHDFSARNDPKLQKLLRRHGMAGLGLYWCVVEILHEQDGYLQINDCEDVAFALHADAKMLESLLRDFDLFSADATRFWSDSALRRIEERKSRSASAKQSAEKRWRDANALRLQSERTANAVPAQSEGNAIKESKGNERKEKLAAFCLFWDAYGKKLDRAKAEKAWLKIPLEKMPEIIDSAAAYAKTIRDPQYQPYPATWLNAERWNDERSALPKYDSAAPHGRDPQGNILPAL